MVKRFLVLAGAAFSLFLVWFATVNYLESGPIAEENLRGLALSLVAAIENIASRDASFLSLVEFRPADVAFFAIIDRQGIYRFHSNIDLIGMPAVDDRFRKVFDIKAITEARVSLRTGENAYEIYTPFSVADKPYVLRLALHTYRADTVVRRARFNMGVLLLMLLVGWTLGIVLFRFVAREERHRADMARRERFARMGEMGATLAHEIRNPLAGIKGYAQVIQRRPAEQRNAGFAGRIIAETVRLEHLVSELLAYAGTESYKMSPVDVGPVIDSTVSLIRQEAEQLRVAIEIGCAEGMRVSGSSDRLGQVLLNLLKNSLQAMPLGGVLKVAAESSGGNVVLDVTDSGEGISAADLPRVFNPFFTTKPRGTGIGLALCKKIVEEHKGRIHISSVPGQGTSVTVILPALKKKSVRGI